MTDSRPLRVLVACDHIGYDGKLHGSGRIMVEMAAFAGDATAQLVPVVLQPDPRLEGRLRSEGVELAFLGYNRFDPRQILRLVRLIRQHDVDLVHVWDFGASTYGRIAALLTRTPAVVHVHSHHSEHQRRGFPGYVRLAYRLLAPLTARAVALAESMRQFAASEMGFAPDRIVVVPNPAPRTVARPPDPAEVERLRAEYGLDPATPVIGSLTRFFEAKGLRYLIESLPTVVERCPEVRVLLVGDGPLRGDLERRASELGVADRIVFAGYRDDVASHLALFTVMAMPSLEEGMPIAALEAIMAGVPVVATTVGGFPELVTEERTGLLVEPADTEGLAKALIRVLDDPSLLERMREGCAAERERISFDRFWERVTDVYRDVARGR